MTRRATRDTERAALHREATLLGLARHPGVVEVVRADPVSGELVGELALAAPTAETLGALDGPPDEVLRVLAAACETLADLHALGLVHGAIGPDHILVEPGQPPVLGGFARAALAGEPGCDGVVRRPADDVAAMAELVRLARRESPHRRPRRSAGGGSDPGIDDLDALLVDAAEGRPPPARRLARAIAHEVATWAPPASRRAATQRREVAEAIDRRQPPPPDADPFARLRPVDVAPSRRRGPRVLTLVAAVAGVAALTAGALGLGLGSRTASRPRLDASSTTDTTAAAAPVRGPGPAEVAVAHRGLLVVGAVRYRVGGPGDEALAADWGCRGATTVVVLRRATGEVFLFRRWARPHHDVRAEPGGRVAPGSHLRAGTDRGGCAVAYTAAPGGRRQPVASTTT